MPDPVIFQYQKALDEFRREGREPPLLKRMSELISLLDLTTTLDSALPGEDLLDAALLIVMGELQASRGALLVRRHDGGFAVRASRGLPAGAAGELPQHALPEAGLLAGAAPPPEILAALGLEVLCPVTKGGRVLAVLGLGARAGGRSYGEEEVGFLRSVAGCSATPIENGLIYEELQRVNQRLSVKVFQLKNLFDISRELTTSFEEEGIRSLVTTTLMGHLMISRCSLFTREPGGSFVAHDRGVPAGAAPFSIGPEEGAFLETMLPGPSAVSDLPEGRFRSRLLEGRMWIVLPLPIGGRNEGLFALGERASGRPFDEEDQDFVLTLGRQALAALQNVRLQRMRMEKLRQDRELQIAREIQQSLFPSSCPAVVGFDIAATSQPCYQVGGDLYDFIPLDGDRLAIAVADVSGKGTPASILMASLHASLRALAGTTSPARLMDRLNAFIFASTQANKYATLFYAELDPAARRLSYVSAGHVPAFVCREDGATSRLEIGGPVLGLLEDAAFEVGEATLGTGDLVGVVTDGATEASSPEDEEFGDQRVHEVLASGRGCGSVEIVSRLVGSVREWAGPRGCSDDLTALVLRAL
jgi:sigma-B regulation protein RsbU (phosphoserine phosphatase)